jgi:hypothetical protein
MKQSSERWRPISDGYWISDHGRVYSEKSGKLLKLHRNTERSSDRGSGYFYVTLQVPNHQTLSVHRLVAEFFVHNPNHHPQVNHIDGNKTNNHYSNLEWCTHRHNIKHAYSLGLMNKKGEKHNRAKLNGSEVLEIRRLYKYGESTKLAKEYNISKSTVLGIVNNKAWKHLV